MYYLYHIPGKKIGVTRNLNKRVTQTQGYKPTEYEVLDQSDDIDYISQKELELQKSYGYKVDIKPYKNLFKMKVNVTDQTTTFPVPVAKVKGRLMDQIGMTWTTNFGKILLDVETAQWIASNAHTSMFNSDRSYVYNKALWEFFCSHNSLESLNIETDKNIFDSIRTWARVRGLYEKGDENTQYVKLQEEAGELAKALLKDDQPEVVDAIGDIIVVLTNLAHLRGVKIEDCIESAYNVISKRTGKMINGTFVKDEKKKDI
jgi:NTP pyrophosphatase (non-canonical NTP hydrolase)